LATQTQLSSGSMTPSASQSATPTVAALETVPSDWPPATRPSARKVQFVPVGSGAATAIVATVVPAGTTAAGMPQSPSLVDGVLPHRAVLW